MNTNLTCSITVALTLMAGSAFSQVTLQNAYDEFVKTADILKEGDMKAYYILSDGVNSEEYSNTFKISEIKKENGKIVSFKLDMDNYSEDIFTPNHKETPYYWKGKNSNIAVIYKEYIVLGSYGAPGDANYRIQKFVKIGSGKKGMFQGMFASSAQIKNPFTKEEVLESVKPFMEADKQRLANEEKNKEAAAAAHREKYSIKGKDVTKIEIEANHGAKLGHGAKFTYGIIATLKDGSKIKTKNLGGEGYLDDYEVTIHGDIDGDLLNPNTISLKPYNYKGDYIQISAKSKHHPSLAGVNQKYVLTYDLPIELNFSGLNSTVDGDPGKSLRIDVKVVNHSETKEEILEYRIYDESSNLINKFRLRRDVQFRIISNGGNGGDKRKDSQCGRGGDGGNITLNLDPKVGDDYQFDYQNMGGKGGINKDNSFRNGTDGRDGRFTKNVKTIN